MAVTIEVLLIGASLLLLVSVLASKVSDRFGIPALLLFLVLGMLAGSDGPGGIYFDDPVLAQYVGVVALALILFSGGMDTEWKSVRPVLKYGIALSTLGVLLTALTVGVFVRWILRLSLLESLLVGAIISSTDAAAVFSILRSKGLSLKARLKPLLELESGSNDPMAVFLTVGLIQLLTQPGSTPFNFIVLFILQMSLGGMFGLLMGRSTQYLMNRLKLGYEGLYPVLMLGMVLFTYGFANLIGGNGFLAVYTAGLLLGNRDFIHKRRVLRFYDGLAWLMQITMFLTLGLLVFPSRLIPVIGSGLLVAGFLLFVARPLSVFLSLPVKAISLREKTFISWVGLRGAVPIVLATYLIPARIPTADLIFNIVFFIVLASVVLQGASVSLVARWLRVDTPFQPKRIFPIEYRSVDGLKSELQELVISLDSKAAGKAIVELGLPADLLVILIARGNEYVIPSGGTVLEPNDTLLVLAEKEVYEAVKSRIG